MIIGSHVSMSGKKMFLGSVETSIENGANALMIYTGAPQNTRRKAIEDLRIPEGRALLTEHDFKDVVVHAPYIVNLGNTFKHNRLVKIKKIWDILLNILSIFLNVSICNHFGSPYPTTSSQFTLTINKQSEIDLVLCRISIDRFPHHSKL